MPAITSMPRRTRSESSLDHHEHQQLSRTHSFGASTDEIARAINRQPTMSSRAARIFVNPFHPMVILNDGGDMLICNTLPGEFLERQHSLTTLVRRMTSHVDITDAERDRFELELRNYHAASVSDLERHFKTSTSNGLCLELAQVRLINDGPNIVKPAYQLPTAVKLLLSFFSGFAPLLWIATFFVFLSWEPFGSPPDNVYNLALAIVLIIVIVVSGFVMFYQEQQATKILAGFQTLIPNVATVIRDGDTLHISATELVAGDVVVLEQGSRVPADIRVILSHGLKVDKSMLTGESKPVKITSEPDKSTDSNMLRATNICFMGCTVVEGEGRGIVIAVGANNQLAKIAAQASTGGAAHGQFTTLQREVNRFVMIIAVFALVTGVTVILVWAFWLHVQHPSFLDVSSMLANTIAVIVAFVPEGLPLALAVGLNIIARRLCGAYYVLVKRLGTIETVGSMSLLASDKTGTLTQNKMVVTAAVGADGVHVSVPSMVVAVMACQQQQQQQQDSHMRQVDREGKSEGRDDVYRQVLSSGGEDEGISGGGGGVDILPQKGGEVDKRKVVGEKEEDEVKDDVHGDNSGFDLPWMEAVLIVSALCNQATVHTPANVGVNIVTSSQTLAQMPSQTPSQIPSQTRSPASMLSASHPPSTTPDRFNVLANGANGIRQQPLPVPSSSPSLTQPPITAIQTLPTVVGGNTTDRVVLQMVCDVFAGIPSPPSVLSAQQGQIPMHTDTSHDPAIVALLSMPEDDIPIPSAYNGPGPAFEDPFLRSFYESPGAETVPPGLYYRRPVNDRAEGGADAGSDLEGNNQNLDLVNDHDDDELYQYSDSGSGTIGSGTGGSQANTSNKSQGSSGVYLAGAGGVGSVAAVTGQSHGTGGTSSLLPSTQLPSTQLPLSTSPPPTVSPPIPSVVTSREGSIASMRLASIPEGSGSGSHSGHSDGSDRGRDAGGRERKTKNDQASTSSSSSADRDDDHDMTSTNIHTLKDVHALLSSFRIKATCPFNSTTKIAYTAVQRGQHVYVLAKGAPELILTRCTHYILPPAVALTDAHSGPIHGSDFQEGDAAADRGASAGGNEDSFLGTSGGASGNQRGYSGCRPLPITKEIRRQLQRHLTEESSKGQRVVALALRVEHNDDHSHNRGNNQRNASTTRNAATTTGTALNTPNRKKNYSGGSGGGGLSSEGDFPYPSDGLTFIGFLSISDPPREGVREAVLTIRGAGIVVAMVTGDAPETALAIARAVGIVDEETHPSHPRPSRIGEEQERHSHDESKSPFHLSHSDDEKDGDDDDKEWYGTTHRALDVNLVGDEELIEGIDEVDGGDNKNRTMGRRAKNNLLTEQPSSHLPSVPNVYQGVDVVPPSLLEPKRDANSDWQRPSTPGYQRLLDLKPLQELPLRSPPHIPRHKKKDTAASSDSKEINQNIESKFGGEEEGEEIVIDIEHGVPFTFFTSTPTPRSTTPRGRPGRTPLSPVPVLGTDGYDTDDTAGFVDDPAGTLQEYCAGGYSDKEGHIALSPSSPPFRGLLPSSIHPHRLHPLARHTAVLIEGKDIEMLTRNGWDFVFAHSEMVFARTTPDQKLQIVKESQRRGHRVGVTGDGVNDAPALKCADVGIAMNAGSDAAKDASAIVLLHNDFAATAHAVREGRLIFINLRKAIAYQIAGGGWSELLPVLATFFLGMPQPLSSFLMIIVSCLTDVYAGIALMNEPPEGDILKNPPRDIHREHLVTAPLVLYSYLFYGTMISIGAFFNYFYYMAHRGTSSLPTPLPPDAPPTTVFPINYTPHQLLFAWNWRADPTSALGQDQQAAMNVASSVYFVTLVVAQMGHLLSVRSKTPYFADWLCTRRCVSCAGQGSSGDSAGHSETTEEEKEEPVVGPLHDTAVNDGSSTSRPIVAITAATALPSPNPCGYVRWGIIFAWFGSIATALIFTEVPFIQQNCGTGSVPGLYWGVAVGWSVCFFVIAEIRKWLLFLFPSSIVAQWLSW